jgi:hypothetical protein
MRYYARVAKICSNSADHTTEKFPKKQMTPIYGKKFDFNIIWPSILKEKDDLDVFHSYAVKAFNSMAGKDEQS